MIFNKQTWDRVLSYIASKDIETPCLLMDSHHIRTMTERIGRGIRNSRLFYAMKANPDIDVVRIIHEKGLSFEIASSGELKVLETLGVPADRIITSNPVKSTTFIRDAYTYGIKLFAFDSEEEVEKLSRFAPEANVYVRLSVPNEGSEWPLSRKFGVEPDEAMRLLLYSAERGLNPVGITFHVGSQCNNPYNWATAVEKARWLWQRATNEGLSLRILNIGGGYPVYYTREIPSIEKIEGFVDNIIMKNFPEDVEVHIEPGRAIVAEAGVYVTRVIGKAKRGMENWLYIDVGVFNGLMESIGGIRYTFIVGSRAEMKRWTIAGPSCDSFDVIAHDVELPEPAIDDLLLIPSAGAYTISYASEFNGFPIPRCIVI